MTSIKQEPNERYVIVRCWDKRFYAGFTRSFQPPIVLEHCRLLVRWNAKTWFDLAIEGPTDPSDCLFSGKVERVYLADVIEIVVCTKRAMLAISAIQDPPDCESEGEGESEGDQDA
jgi:hypothetical protein